MPLRSAVRSTLVACAVASASVLALVATSVPATAAATPAASSGTPIPAHVFAPYFEAYNGDSLSGLSTESGAKYLTMAFIQTPSQGSCTADWNGDSSTPISAANFGSDIAAIQAGGGNVIPSFGGYSADHGGTDIADSCTNVASIAAAYESVVTTYNVTRIDLDIEDNSLTDTAGITRRNEAVAQAEAWAAANGRTLQFSYTMPTESTGLDSTGVAVLQNAVAEGARVDVVNMMTFDYYYGTKQEMATDTESSAAGLVSQLASLYPSKSTAQLWAMVGITEMIGIDDYGADETFTTADAATVLNWAKAKGISTLSFWALQRDNGGCVGTAGSDSCSGISQSTWYFSNAFEPFTSSGSGTGGSPGDKTYEADQATIGGSADANSCSACLDGKKVSSIGGGGAGTVTFTGVSEPSTGSYTMTVSYLSVSKARPAVITVNGTAQTVTFAETSASSYSVIGTATVTVKLNAGSSNTIEFSGSGTSGAPDLDHIVV